MVAVKVAIDPELRHGFSPKVKVQRQGNQGALGKTNEKEIRGSWKGPIGERERKARMEKEKRK